MMVQSEGGGGGSPYIDQHRLCSVVLTPLFEAGSIILTPPLDPQLILINNLDQLKFLAQRNHGNIMVVVSIT